MPKITIAIPPAAFELIRERICEILADEFAGQAIITPAAQVPTVWCERIVPFDKTGIPALNVMLSNGSFAGHTNRETNGTYTYFIDCYTSAPTTTTGDGFTSALKKLHYLLNQVRAILESPMYRTLGFAPPFIANRHATSFNIGQPDTKDGASIVMGRLTYEVTAPETMELVQRPLLAGYDTTVTLFNTSLGYKYTTQL